ncbi:hypothetical protein WN51_05398, partial [Melipona quadrifasciata]
ISAKYAKRFEAVFLCYHPKGPKMTVRTAAKYLRYNTEVRTRDELITKINIACEEIRQNRNQMKSTINSINSNLCQQRRASL